MKRMTPISLTTSLVAGVLLHLFLSGCALKERVTPVNNTFLEDVNVNSRLATLPFDHSWVRRDFNGQPYNKLFLKPIRTDLLPDDAWMRSASGIITSQADYEQEAREIATHFRQQLAQSLRESEFHRFELVPAPGRDVLTLEIALTELEFSHPVARAASLAAPVPGTGPALSSMSDPHAAFAARMYDGSGALVATVADRKFPPTRIVDLNKLTVTSSVREVCTLWGVTLAEVINKGRLVPTEGPSRFSLRPW